MGITENKNTTNTTNAQSESMGDKIKAKIPGMHPSYEKEGTTTTSGTSGTTTSNKENAHGPEVNRLAGQVRRDETVAGHPSNTAHTSTVHGTHHNEPTIGHSTHGTTHQKEPISTTGASIGHKEASTRERRRSSASSASSVEGISRTKQHTTTTTTSSGQPTTEKVKEKVPGLKSERQKMEESHTNVPISGAPGVGTGVRKEPNAPIGASGEIKHDMRTGPRRGESSADFNAAKYGASAGVAGGVGDAALGHHGHATGPQTTTERVKEKVLGTQENKVHKEINREQNERQKERDVVTGNTSTTEKVKEQIPGTTENKVNKQTSPNAHLGSGAGTYGTTHGTTHTSHHETPAHSTGANHVGTGTAAVGGTAAAVGGGAAASRHHNSTVPSTEAHRLEKDRALADGHGFNSHGQGHVATTTGPTATEQVKSKVPGTEEHRQVNTVPAAAHSTALGTGVPPTGARTTTQTTHENKGLLNQAKEAIGVGSNTAPRHETTTHGTVPVAHNSGHVAPGSTTAAHTAGGHHSSTTTAPGLGYNQPGANIEGVRRAHDQGLASGLESTRLHDETRRPEDRI